MRRIALPERPHWRRQAESLGFRFHTFDGEPYWDETAYYAFDRRQIEEDIEAPTEELHQMCLDLVARAVADEAMLKQLAIPEAYWDYVRDSWLSGQPHIYGRMDFGYDGTGPAKLYELNYDTPTSLYESAFFQWLWLEEQLAAGTLPAGADQFNSLQEQLIAVFGYLRERMPAPFYFASCRDSLEDRGTVDYLRDCAAQAGFDARWIAVEDIGASVDGRYTDLEHTVLPALFKLYPWEYMFREEFGPLLPRADTLIFEPPWKAILSNKGALPLLWELHPGHPNLLPAHFEAPGAELKPGWVRKPLFSREGANISLRKPDGETETVDGPYGDIPTIVQAFHPLPRFGDSYTLIGSWIVADNAAGIGIREDASLITKDSSRFLPHIFVD
ncbi:MAG: glutathionylspermidine synthase family protein [Gammaproteobacteria bacterium]|nr:glutathionylspermidine synthase family protein [Gammaproteobacteria bacterium]